MRNTACLIAVTILALLCAAPTPRDATVDIAGMKFSPAVVKVQAGQAVTWVNNDDRDHSIDGSEVSSGNIKPGKSFTYTFPKAGRYTYGCAYHPRMRGTVVVSE